MFWTESEDIFPKTFLLNNQLAQHGDIELSGGMGGLKRNIFATFVVIFVVWVNLSQIS